MPFSKSAHVYDAIYTATRDYAAQADSVATWVLDRNPQAASLLDVACGTGLHLQHLASSFEVAGVDISREMVARAVERNPGADVICGDMRSFNFGRRFDAVICMFSSITYAGSLAGLQSAISNFARHLNPGGICVIEPYIDPSDWEDGVLGLRTARRTGLAVAMVDRAIRTGNDVRREIGYVVASSDGLESINEVHEYRLFSRQEYNDALQREGFAVEFLPEAFVPRRGMYVGVLGRDA